jgi:hypothetical protein
VAHSPEDEPLERAGEHLGVSQDGRPWAGSQRGGQLDAALPRGRVRERERRLDQAAHVGGLKARRDSAADRVADVADVGDGAIESLERLAQRRESKLELGIVLGRLGQVEQQARRAEQALEVMRDHAQEKWQRPVDGLELAH